MVERAVILARRSVLELSDFELPGFGSASARPAGGGAPADERKQIEDALAAEPGRVSGAQGAVKVLGIPVQHSESAHSPPRDRQARLQASGAQSVEDEGRSLTTATRARGCGWMDALASSVPVNARQPQLEPPRTIQERAALRPQPGDHAHRVMVDLVELREIEHGHPAVHGIEQDLDGIDPSATRSRAPAQARRSPG